MPYNSEIDTMNNTPTQPTMAKKMIGNVEWVLITDESFYDMFCVHPKADTAYDSPRRFHFVYKEDAEKFKELIEKSHCAVPNDR